MVTKMIVISLALCIALASASAAPDAGVTAPRTYEIGSDVPPTRVAVMDLKVSGEYYDQVKDWLPALLEDRLLAEGWTLVVRGERMQHIQQERNLPGIKPETRLPENELLGATAFLELTARVQVRHIQGLAGYKMFSIGDFARATVDLNGQIVDPATGVLKSSVNTSGSARGVKTALVVSVGSDWRIGGGGYNIKGLRETLVGKAADEAARGLIERLKALYPSLPNQRSAFGMQPASTTVKVGSSAPSILLDLPDPGSCRAGDRYGIYRGEELVAEVEVVRLAGKRAEAKILSQTGPIQPTDTARPMPVVIRVEQK